MNLNFFKKSRGLSDELPRYGVVIVVSFLADFGTLYVLKNRLNYSLPVSVLGSYAVGVYVNYVLSSHWVFGTRRFKNDYKEPFYFWLIALAGALMSLAVIRLLDHFGIGLLVAKVLAEGSVAVLSFGGKKILLFSDFDSYQRVWRLYCKAPSGARVHTIIRFVSLPYKRLINHIPSHSKSLVEIGCGHGLLCNLIKQDLALDRVYGYDIDAQKITVAALPDAGAEFGTKPPVKQLFDIVLIADVLYLLNDSDQTNMVKQALSICKKGGTVLIKEMALTPRWKYLVNYTQEFLSVRVLRITAHADKAVFKLADLGELAYEMRSLGHEAHVTRIDQGYFHPHSVLVITKGVA